MKIVFGADYRAMTQRDALVGTLSGLGDVVDVVQQNPALTDYVEVSEQVVKQMTEPEDRGVIICGTGIGITIVANKHAGISAARCVSAEDAVDCKTVNNSNVLCLSAKTPVERNQEIIRVFFATEFPRDERRTARLVKITDLERRNFK